ncbi:hypothetical protein ACFWVC_38030 [Streptomyces sp. NPDC058691]
MPLVRASTATRTGAPPRIPMRMPKLLKTAAVAVAVVAITCGCFLQVF